MSLNRTQREATKAELQANIAQSGRGIAEIAEGLGVTTETVEETLRVDGADPASVWRLRDHLETAILARGLRPHPYSSLTPQMRSSAALWFGV
jgi:hypothetical protein